MSNNNKAKVPADPSQLNIRMPGIGIRKYLTCCTRKVKVGRHSLVSDKDAFYLREALHELMPTTKESNLCSEATYLTSPPVISGQRVVIAAIGPHSLRAWLMEKLVAGTWYKICAKVKITKHCLLTRPSYQSFLAEKVCYTSGSSSGIV